MKTWNTAAWLLCFIALIPTTGCNSSPTPSTTPQTTPPVEMRGNEGPDLGIPSENPSLINLSITPESSAQAMVWRSGKPSKLGIIFVSGVDGGFVEPVDGIYDRIAAEWLKRDVPSIFVQYRNPGELEPSVADALAAAQYLRKLGVTRMAIVGWSFGGAVITNSAVKIPEVTTVVGFAPQARDTEAVEQFTQQSILLIHSKADENVPYESSQQILDDTPTQIRKRLFTLETADHILSGQSRYVDPVVMDWLRQEL